MTGLSVLGIERELVLPMLLTLGIASAGLGAAGGSGRSPGLFIARRIPPMRTQVINDQIARPASTRVHACGDRGVELESTARNAMNFGQLA